MTTNEEVAARQEVLSCILIILLVFIFLGLVIHQAAIDHQENEKLRVNSTGRVIKIVEIMVAPSWVFMAGNHTPEEEAKLKEPKPATLAIIQVEEDDSVFSQQLTQAEIAYVVTNSNVVVTKIPNKTSWEVKNPKTWKSPTQTSLEKE